MTANSMSKEYMVYKCKECPAVCLNSLDLQIHKFLHQDLTYFFCPDCDHIFGVPSKLKRHFFLAHESILDSELQYVLDMENRVEITLRIQEYMTASDTSKVALVDNFLDASLDAKLVMDEITMTEEVENIPLNSLGQILSQYITFEAKTDVQLKTMYEKMIPKCEEFEESIESSDEF